MRERWCAILGLNQYKRFADRDWLTIRRLKTTFGSYILDSNDPNTLGGVDSKIAATVWIREAMEVMANPYGDWEFQNSAVAYRAEDTSASGSSIPLFEKARTLHDVAVEQGAKCGPDCMFNKWVQDARCKALTRARAFEFLLSRN